MASLTRWVLARARLVTIGWLVLTLVGMMLAGPTSRRLSQDYSVPGREGWETNQAITRMFHRGGNTPPLVAVITVPPGANVDLPSVTFGLARLRARVQRALPGARVASYTGRPTTAGATTGDAAFVSADHRTVFAVIDAPPEPHSYGLSPHAQTAVRAALRGMTVLGQRVRLTGFDALQDTSGARTGPGVFVEALLGGLGALVVLAFVFASLQALIPLLTAIVSIMTTFILLAALTAVTDVSALVLFLVSLVGLGVAIDYSLLIVVRWREERMSGTDGDEAVVRAMQTAGRAVVFSGTTVAIGLLALIALPVPFLRSVGYGGLLIPLVSVSASITLVPILLARWGRKLEWPHRRGQGRAGAAWTRWAATVLRRRWPAAAVGGGVLIALAAAALSLNVGGSLGNPDVLAQRGDAKAGLTQLERAGIGTGPLAPVQVLTAAASADGVARALGGLPGVSGAVAPDGAAWRRDGRAVVDVFPLADDSSAAGRATLGRIRARVHAAAAGARVGGLTAQNRDFVDAVYGSFPVMVALIAIITFILLARAFRSLLLPLKAVVLNILSVGAAWGVLTLVWQRGIGSEAIWGIAASGSIPAWMPVVVFAFLFGLSMDYEVFILARMREAYDRTGSTSRAVVMGIGRTGRLVTSAALILVLTFVAMASGPQVTLKMMATGMAAGILIDALVIRALLVPALVALLGRWNWWLPRAPARLLRVEPSLPPRAEPAESAA